MEWRIIVPLLCLIGILHVPGNAAQTSTNGTNSTFDIVFHIDLQFNSNYTNMNNNDTINLNQNITSQVRPVYTGLKNFQAFEILSFRNGSIVVEGKLYFNSSDAKPIAANLTQLLHDTNFTFTLLKNFTRITEVTPPAVSPNASTTASPPASSTASPPATTVVALSFKINQVFKSIYSNLSDPETEQLAKNITNAVSPHYRRFSNFRNMTVKKFSPGSIAVDSEIQFDTSNGTKPNLTEVKNTLTDAVNSGNLTLPINVTSISVTDISNGTNVTATTTNTTTTTSAATTLASSVIAEYNITFKIKDTFTSELTNISSPTAKALEKNISDQCGVAYKYLSGFIRMLVQKYSNGSIVVDGALQFNKTNSTPSVKDLATVLADNVRNGTVTLQIDPTSIKVTDANGITANKSPVLASMLTAFWMTLASLLLSAVMH